MKLHILKATFFLLAFLLLISPNAYNNNQVPNIETYHTFVTVSELNAALKTEAPGVRQQIKQNIKMKPAGKMLPGLEKPSDPCCAKC